MNNSHAPRTSTFATDTALRTVTRRWAGARRLTAQARAVAVQRRGARYGHRVRRQEPVVYAVVRDALGAPFEFAPPGACSAWFPASTRADPHPVDQPSLVSVTTAGHAARRSASGG